MRFLNCTLLVWLVGLAAIGYPPTTQGARMDGERTPAGGSELATFGGGCFWCTEAVFQELAGVLSVESGYSGGRVANPTYQQVSTGATGHAEVIQIRFDPDKVSYLKLLEVFFKTHDPTTLNRQGPDIGTQYRSVVFYHNEEQKIQAEKVIRGLNASKAFRRPIVTQLEPFTQFYKAEAYHQDYFRNNPKQAYCARIIRPKMDKFRKVFKDLLK